MSSPKTMESFKKTPQINLNTQLLQPTCVLALLFLLQTKNIESH